MRCIACCIALRCQPGLHVILCYTSVLMGISDCPVMFDPVNVVWALLCTLQNDIVIPGKILSLVLGEICVALCFAFYQKAEFGGDGLRRRHLLPDTRFVFGGGQTLSLQLEFREMCCPQMHLIARWYHNIGLMSYKMHGVFQSCSWCTGGDSLLVTQRCIRCHHLSHWHRNCEIIVLIGLKSLLL